MRRHMRAVIGGPGNWRASRRCDISGALRDALDRVVINRAGGARCSGCGHFALEVATHCEGGPSPYETVYVVRSSCNSTAFCPVGSVLENGPLIVKSWAVVVPEEPTPVAVMSRLPTTTAACVREAAAVVVVCATVPWIVGKEQPWYVSSGGVIVCPCRWLHVRSQAENAATAGSPAVKRPPMLLHTGADSVVAGQSEVIAIGE
eukprot:scaffold58453_cov85-Phaeocystis_antarctica.AAC.9